MSYTKLQKEVDKYYKSIGRKTTYNAFNVTPEQVTDMKKFHANVENNIFEQWKNEGKYKELISVAHGGWFEYDKFIFPLAKLLLEKNEIIWLKILYEKSIRLDCKNLLFCLKVFFEIYGKISPNKILDCHQSHFTAFETTETIKYQKIAIATIDDYLGFLSQTLVTDYIQKLLILRQKIVDLTIRNSDLAFLKAKQA